MQKLIRLNLLIAGQRVRQHIHSLFCNLPPTVLLNFPKPYINKFAKFIFVVYCGYDYLNNIINTLTSTKLRLK